MLPMPNMKYVIAFWACLVAGLFADRANACDMVLLRAGLPREEGTLGLGLVIGHGMAARPIAAIENAPSLHVRIDTVISGNIASGESEIVPLFYGPDCQSTPTDRTMLERSYPVGTMIAFSTTAIPRDDAHSTRSIVVESNHGGFVVAVPGDAARTRDGDLDFEHFDAPQRWQFGEFEFVRAVIALRRSRPPEKFGRLMNLAHYQGFRDQRGREWLAQLISESRLTRSQREAVLQASEQEVPRAR